MRSIVILAAPDERRCRSEHRLAGLPVSDKLGKIPCYGIVAAKEGCAAPADEAMITSTVCEIVWFAGLVGWYIIRYPF